jgi:AraC-like DNA-binding protein
MKTLPVASVVARHIMTDGIQETAVPSLTLFRASSASEYDATVYQPSLCIVSQGAKEVVVGDETYQYDPSSSLLVSVDLPATSRVIEASPDEPCLVVVIALDMALVGELLARVWALPTSNGSGRGVCLAPMDNELMGAVERLLALLDSPQDIETLAPLILQEITYRVMTGPQGARLRQIASAGAPAYRISKAIQWLRSNFTEPLSVDSLAKQVGLSTSSLHQHFKNLTAMSPLQFQKRLRLQEAKRLLLAESLDAAEAGYRVGYESPSQFSREYRRMYGAPPRKDIAALRSDAAPMDLPEYNLQ